MEESKQTPEEIREILETALKEERLVDLVIVTDGISKFTPDLIVEAVESDFAWMSYYVDDKGELGEVIPLKLSRIKAAEIQD